ncbi:MAG: hypothetical protein NVSMB66_2290 [Candidatus Doudnabacteria bacterium]
MNPAALRKELRQSPKQENTPMCTPLKRSMEEYLFLRMKQMIEDRNFWLITRPDSVNYACGLIFNDDPEAMTFLRGAERPLSEYEITVAVRIRDRLAELAAI